MKAIQGSFDRIFLTDSITCYQFSDALSLHVQPGQFMAVRGERDILPTLLFPVSMQGDVFATASGETCGWQPGELLNIRFPLGKGFSIHSSARRLLMVSGTSHPHRLLPAAGKILRERGETALFTNFLPESISPEIELLSREELADAFRWADCIIGDAEINSLRDWKEMITTGNSASQKKVIQILVDTPMACLGAAECGVCAIKTHRGWKHACSDGPVFSLEELDL